MLLLGKRIGNRTRYPQGADREDFRFCRPVDGGVIDFVAFFCTQHGEFELYRACRDALQDLVEEEMGILLGQFVSQKHRASAHSTDTIGLSSSIPSFQVPLEANLIGTNYKCEICGDETSTPVRWFVIQCSDSKLGIFKWDAAEADQPRALHFCGEGHAQIYISRWFESFCGSSVMLGGK